MLPRQIAASAFRCAVQKKQMDRHSWERTKANGACTTASEAQPWYAPPPTKICLPSANTNVCIQIVMWFLCAFFNGALFLVRCITACGHYCLLAYIPEILKTRLLFTISAHRGALCYIFFSTACHGLFYLLTMDSSSLGLRWPVVYYI